MLNDAQMQKAFDYWMSWTTAERALMRPESRICVGYTPDTFQATKYLISPYESASVYEVLQWAGNKTDALMKRVTELELENKKYEHDFFFRCQLCRYA
jgi:hypothetical protein